MKNFTILILLLTSNVILGQSFIEELDIAEFLSENSRNTIFQERISDTYTESVVPIRLNNVWHFQERGILTFNLPHSNEDIIAYVKKIDGFDRDNFIWTADLKDNEGNIKGYCSFFIKGPKSYGTINYDGTQYIIEHLNDGDDNKQLLIEVDENINGPGCSGPYNSPTASDDPISDQPYHDTYNEGPTSDGKDNGDDDTVITTRSNCAAEITVLFLLTPEAAASSFDAEQISDIGIEQLNIALSESLNEDDDPVEVVKIGIEIVSPGNYEITNSKSILEKMALDPEILSLRDDYDADFIVLYQLTDMTFLTEDNELIEIGGLAYRNFGAFEDQAYSVIELDDSNTTPLLEGHEIGHLFGCGHLDASHPYAKAYEWNNSNEFFKAYVTIMKSSLDGNVIPLFSNPNHNHPTNEDDPTGTEDRDNTRMICKNACTMARFGEGIGEGQNPPTQSFYSFINGPTYVYQDMYIDFTWSTLDYGCSGNIEYNWDIDITVGLPVQYVHLSTDATATLDGAIVPNNVPTVFLRSETTCLASGESDERIKSLTNWSAQNFQEKDVIEVRQSKDKSFDFDVYPNPASNVVNVPIEVISKKLNAWLITLDGKKVDITSNITMKESYYSIDLINIPSNFYLLHLVDDNVHITKPLKILK